MTTYDGDNSDLATAEPITADSLHWLDGDLPPELADIEYRNFLIADTFDITSSFLLDILADDTPTFTNFTQPPRGTMGSATQRTEEKEVAVQPADDEWNKF